MWTSLSIAPGAQLRTGKLLLLSVMLPGCAGPVIPARMPQPEKRSIDVGTRVHERIDPATGKLVRRWHVTSGSDGVPLLDGADEAWWPDGSRRHVRSWVLGEEGGSWQSWHSNGVLRSTASFDAESGTMRFWHSNGVLAAEGLHEGGTRVGVWTFYHESGGRKSEGSFALNRREGAWTLWREDGVIEAAGMYAAGVRVGEWFLAPKESPESESGT